MATNAPGVGEVLDASRVTIATSKVEVPSVSGLTVGEKIGCYLSGIIKNPADHEGIIQLSC